jgi:hypothetical protein
MKTLTANYFAVLFAVFCVILFIVWYSNSSCDKVSIELSPLIPWRLMPAGIFALPDVSKAIDWIEEERGGSVVLPQNTVWGKNGPPPTVLDQGQWGSCTAFAMRYAYLLWLLKKNFTIIEPSVAFLYARSRLLIFPSSSLRDSGSTTSATVHVMRTRGLPSASQWPYSAPNVFAIPPSFPSNTTPQVAGISSAYVGASSYPGFKLLPVVRASHTKLQWQNQAEYFVSEINAGRAILISINCYSNFISTAMLTSGVVPMPSGSLIGGHAICLVGYVKGQTPDSSIFTFYNSWGLYSGFYNNTQGLFSIPFKYAANPSLSGDWWSL